MIRVKDIARAIEAIAPLGLQESWDNSGLQVGNPDMEVRGVMIGLDVTPALVDEALAKGCNMIVSHHPLIFKGLKSVTGVTEVERALIKAVKHDVAIYSTHTALDNASGGVSVEMARLLDAEVECPLVALPGRSDVGTGVIGRLRKPLDSEAFVDRVKEVFDAAFARVTESYYDDEIIERIALCGGAGGSFIADAVKAGCQAYVTGDVRYHDFLDWGQKIMIVDIGHFETEAPAENILTEVLHKAFPRLNVQKSQTEENPIKYI